MKAEFRQGCYYTGLENFVKSREYMKLFNTCTDDYIVRHKA